MKTYIVQLEVHDDVISAKDKISWSKGTRVLLVWPKKGRVLERRVDLLLLQRACHQMGVQMAIVTQSGEVKAYARDLGIPIFGSSIKAQTSSWIRRKRRSILDTIRAEDRTHLDPSHLREDLEALRDPKLTPSLRDQAVRMGAFTLGVLAFLGLALFFAPSARVELTPQRQTQKLTIPVWASQEIHAPNPSGGIPAHLMTAVVEGQDEAASTGRTRIPDMTAAGQLTLTNLTDQPVEVPAGSVALTLTNPPIRFLVTDAVTVPAGAGKTATASIRAAAPGSAGAVSAGQIRAMEGDVGLRLTVENTQATRGGTDRFSPAPSPADYEAIKTKLVDHLKASALEEMQSRLKSGQRILEPSLAINKVIEEDQEPKIDQPADRFQLSMRVEVSAWYVEESDLRAVAQAALDANRSPGFQTVQDSLSIDFAEEPQWVDSVTAESPAPVNSVRWTLKVSRTLEAKWSRDSAMRAVLGRSLPDATRILSNSLPLAETPRINLFPAWWVRLPYLPFRIEVVTQ